MFDHIGIHVSDLERSERFYTIVLGTLGHEAEADQSDVSWGEFFIGAADEEHQLAQHLHVGFVAWSREQVDRFHQAGVAAGYASDGEPGPRPQYGGSYYGAFLVDPDGNSIEAVHHDDVRRGGVVDHLWIGVSDLERSVAFYDRISPHAGLRGGTSWEGGRQLRGAWATLSLLADGRPPTRGLHLAFPAPDRRTVEEFHAAALAAGHRDNGAPGERPQYHPGYYAAFVLDPDGTNVESVFHDRR